MCGSRKYPYPQRGSKAEISEGSGGFMGSSSKKDAKIESNERVIPSTK